MKRRAKIDPHAKSILNNPELMRDVRAESKIESKSNTQIAQMKKLREIIRILRDTPIINDDLTAYKDIEAELASLFPWLPQRLLEFALYIETHASLLPMDLFQLWVSVPQQHLRNLIANSLLEDGDRKRLYAIVGLFLWATLHGYKISSHQEFSFTLRQMEFVYSSIGVGGEKVREVWENLGVKRDVMKETYRSGIVSRTTIKLPSSTILNQYALTHVETNRIRFNAPNQLGLEIPDQVDLLARFSGYALLYPRDDYGEVHPILPWVYFDQSILRVPLTEGIVPQIVAALFTPEELGWLLNRYGTRKRNSRLRTILSEASKRINASDEKLKRFNRISIHMPARHLDRRHDALRVFTGMTHKGVLVDQNILKSFDLDSLNPTLHRIPFLKKERDTVLDIVKNSKNNRLYSKYRYSAYSERVYTRDYSIQGLPNVLKPAIVPDKGMYFVYFDVVANDLTMLIALADDAIGQKLLYDGVDPYLRIAEVAFPSAPNRDQAKAFVNPWLYGATIPTIVANSGNSSGMLNTSEAKILKKSMPLVVHDSVTWLVKLRSEIKKRSIIPSHMNRIEGVDIPIPAILASKHGAVFLIQRFGVTLFRHILCMAVQNGIEPVAFVHDSVLFQVPKSIPPTQAMNEIKSSIHQAMLAKSVNVINVKMGHGDDWASADKSSMKSIITI